MNFAMLAEGCERFAFLPANAAFLRNGQNWQVFK